MNQETVDIKASFFIKLLYATIVAGLAIAFIDYIVEEDNIIALMTDFGLVAASVIGLALHYQSKKLELPAFVYFSTALLVITYLAINNDGLFNPYYPLILMSIGFLSPVMVHRGFLIAQIVVSTSLLGFMIYYHLEFLMGTAKSLKIDKPISVGLVYLIIYYAITVISYFMNKHYDLANKRSSQLSFNLQEMNEEIAAQNEELRQGQEALYELNLHLEEKIEARTRYIKKQNQKLMKYAYDNAHKVRGPLARILGLFYLRHLDKTELLDEDILRKIEAEAQSMDDITKEISVELEANINENTNTNHA